MRKYNVVILLLFITNTAFAQIGYQVSLLNSATGQPRAGETVTVDVKLINSENATVYTTQQKATSNDFGVLSLSVGDAKTFDELDWNKLPLYIEVSIDGVLIAKSQVLSVPVAEYAKKSGFVLTKEFLASKVWNTCGDCEEGKLYFNMDGTCAFDGSYGHYVIECSDVIIYFGDSGEHLILKYVPAMNRLFVYGGYLIFE
ncbi:MAG: hypothetical protein IJ290_04350 [Bacteroidaceae bacterium]|nr:hypothetical protein [Bacteroidaceae bacterium]